MDDFDGERFARGGQSLAAASARPGRRAGRRSARGRGEVPASRVIHRDEDREELRCAQSGHPDRKSTRLNSSHVAISYAVFCLKKKKINLRQDTVASDQ